jgi:cytochrome c
MIARTSTLLSAALMTIVLACEPAAAAEPATKEEAIAMVKKAVAFIPGATPSTPGISTPKRGGRSDVSSGA